MKLIKVRDNQNRPVSTLDIMMGAVFGGVVPREFISGEHYTTGEHVYIIDPNGLLKIMVCNATGTYTRCEDPSFSEWSLDAVIQKNFVTKSDNFLKDVEWQLYDVTSFSSTNEIYHDHNGIGTFSATIPGFDRGKYLGNHDVVDVYLRRNQADFLILPNEYSFDGEQLNIEIPLSEMCVPTTHDTPFLPEGREVDSVEGLDFWYGENGIRKTFDYNENVGFELTDFDMLRYINRDSVKGYTICDLKIEALNTAVVSPLSVIEGRRVIRLDTFHINGEHDPMGSTVDGKIQTIVIPVTIERARKLTDELTITLNTETQTISAHTKNNYIKQVKFSLVAKKLEPVSAFVVGYKAKSPMTHYFRDIIGYGKVVDIASTNGEGNDKNYAIELPYQDMLKYNSFEYELYINRVYCPHCSTFLSNEKIYVDVKDRSEIDWEHDLFVFRIRYTISQNACLTRFRDEQLVEDDKTAFRIPLTKEFINKFQQLNLREDYKLLPDHVVNGSKGFANIIDEHYYMDNGKYIRSDMLDLIFLNPVERMEANIIGYNSETYPIMEDTRELPIPFIDYDIENDDFLIFKSGGVLVSSAKYYLTNQFAKLYNHEDPMKEGDFVDFRLLNRDKTIRINKQFLDFKPNENHEVALPNWGNKYNTPLYLLFTMNGEYISPHKYELSSDYIRFDPNCHLPFDVNTETRLEIVYASFKENHTRTIFFPFSIFATKDNQTDFPLDPTIDYGAGVDSVLIFREDGQYIGEKFYYIDSETDIIHFEGSPVPNGHYIDVYVIRDLSLDIDVPKPRSD